MSDPIRDYLNAGREFQERKTAAATMTKLLYDAVSLIRSNPGQFIAMHYELSLPSGQQFMRNIPRVDMGSWPDAAQVRSMLAEFHKAYLRMHQAWETIPSADRSGPGLTAPPRSLSLPI
jgi:hypothetical protein